MTIKNKYLLLPLLLLSSCGNFFKTQTEQISSKEESHKAHAFVIEITTMAEFEKIITNGKPTIAKFYAPWCPPCQRMKPIFEAVAKKHHDTINFIALNSENKQLAALFEQYSQQGYPTFVFFNNKGILIESRPGSQNENSLEEYIKNIKTV